MMKLKQWQFWFGLALMLVCLGGVYEIHDLKKRVMYARHDAQVSQLQAMLVDVWVHHQVKHQQQFVREEKIINPMRVWYLPSLLYVGEFEYVGDGVRDAWYYDKQQRCLVYVFSNGEKRAYQLSFNPAGIKVWQLKAVQDYQPLPMEHQLMPKK